MKKNHIGLVLASCFNLWQCFGQGIVVVTFEGPPVIPPSSGASVTNYYESGVLFSPLPGSHGFGRLNIDSGSAYPGSLFPCDGSAYLDTLLGDSLAFSFTNSSLFGLVSVDLAEYSTVFSNEPVTIPFIGYHPDGSTIITNFTTDGIIDGTGPLTDFQTFY